LAIVLLLAVLATGCQYIGTSGPRVSFHGDSMGAQADRQIVNRLTRHHRLFRHSVERADIADMRPSIRVLVEEGPLPDVAVVELGSGDAHQRHGDERMRRDIRRVLDLLRDVPCVRWFSLKIAGVNGFYQGYVDRADDFNRVLAREIADYPNARVAPYRQWANAHPEAFKADGLHHTARGKTMFAHFIEDVVDNCP
jgi:hypothetical protein